VTWLTSYVDSLFAALPDGVAVLALIALAVILVSHAWAVALYVRGSAVLRQQRPPDQDYADRLLWVFLVPALDEEVTVADSVARLDTVRAARRLVVVIDDGSVDTTPEVLARLDVPDLVVVRRDPPAARQGKGAALNDAWRRLDDLIAASPYADTAREDVVVAIVDADGRLAPNAPAAVATHFADARVGGVQVAVRIYNRSRLLTWLQDVEFGVYGGLYQQGRSAWGTAGMGGNGQFNRLSALDSVAPTRAQECDGSQDGPWRDRLTEDQDLGLRLIAAGWEGREELRTHVDQQGLPGLRRLYRQRTRWAQGNLQCLDQVGVVRRASVSLAARLDLGYALVLPILQLVVGAATVAAVVCWVVLGVGFLPVGNPVALTAVLLLSFGGTGLGCVARARGRGLRAVLVGLLVAVPYSFYSWIIWPVLLRALVRIAVGSRGWAKTAREPLSVAGQPGHDPD